MGTDFFLHPVVIGQGVNSFKLKEGRLRLDVKNIFFYEGGETLKKVTQRVGRHLIKGNSQGQVGWGSVWSSRKCAYFRDFGLHVLQNSLSIL